MTNPLIGTWHLKSWYLETENGVKHFALGPDASGYISYSEDGYIFVHIIAAGRQLNASDDLFSGTVAEDSAALKSQLSYAGRYEYREGQVTHHVKFSSHPNWVGTEQVRYVRFFDENQLELRANGSRMQDHVGTGYIIWERGTR
ncbi:MAG: lipocalin-like domain-containing protein [Hyphomicrobiaceae bacterium]